MKKIEVVVLISFLLSIIFSNLLIFLNKYDILLNRVVRIHILANSNRKEDQLLKYMVKDEISEKVFNLLREKETKEEAKDEILKNIDKISQISKNVIKQSGYDYAVNVVLTKSYFPTRQYENFVLPAGKYDTLKVEIGEAKGANWWCVAFPPMCSPEYENKAKNIEILGDEQVEMIKNPCQYKFAIIELITDMRYRFENYKKI